jgi:hypothetical protein
LRGPVYVECSNYSLPGPDPAEPRNKGYRAGAETESCSKNLTTLTGLARAAVPGSIVCLIMGMLGLHALLWGREGRLGRLGFVLMGVGLRLGFIGMAGSALGILDPNPIAPMINTGEHAGVVFIGAGMLLWGLLTLRVKALGRWSILPLVMGLLSLMGIVFSNQAAFAALEHSPAPLAFAVCCGLLGYALLTTRPVQSPSTTPSAPGWSTPTLPPAIA